MLKSTPMMSTKRTLQTLMAAFLVASLPNAALAYIGPGAGLGVVAVTIALAIGVLLLLVGLVWYPLKRVLKKNKNKAKDGSE